MAEHGRELTLAPPQIHLTPGVLRYDFTDLREKSQAIAEMIEQIEVTEENVQLTKKLLAKVNKAVTALEAERIRVKKELLEPYMALEIDVKEIVKIVKEADAIARGQVKELDQIERDMKESEIKEVWNTRAKQYGFNFLEFKDFLEPQHLNKSMSMKQVEKDMVQFFEDIEKDVATIKQMPKSKELMAAYMDSLSLQDAISLMATLERNAATLDTSETVHVEDQADFRVYGKKDIALVKRLLTENEISYIELG